MKEEKGKNFVIALLLIIIIALIILVFLSLNGTLTLSKNKANTQIDTIETNNSSNNNTSNSATNTTYNNIKGLYTYKSKENDGEYVEYCKIYLYENGTFNYRVNAQVQNGFIGNYIIEGNKIKLNYLYNYNSGVGLFAVKEEKVLTINQDRNLIDPLYQITKQEIILTKDNNKENTKYFEEKTPNDMIYSNFKETEARLKSYNQ